MLPAAFLMEKWRTAPVGKVLPKGTNCKGSGLGLRHDSIIKWWYCVRKNIEVSTQSRKPTQVQCETLLQHLGGGNSALEQSKLTFHELE